MQKLSPKPCYSNNAYEKTTTPESASYRPARRGKFHMMDGNLVFDGIPIEFENHKLPRGLYIKKEFYKNGQYNASKVYIK